jgi:polar amino acid transport system substrate-binding protein
MKLESEMALKKTASLLGTAILALSLSACGGGSSPASTAPSAAAVEAAPSGLITAGQLKICIDPEYAPLEYFSNGTSGDIIGFDADGARALASYWGLTPTFQQAAFDGLMPALQAKRCDVMWSGLYTSPARLQVADGAKYLNTGPGIVVAAKNKDSIKVADDLCGKTVAAQNGGANAATVRALGEKCVQGGKGNINVAEYPKVAETVLAVTNGKADALVETDVAIADIVAKSNGALVPVEGVFPTDTTFGVFTIKGGPLSEPVDKAVKALIRNGTLAELAKKYGLNPDKLVKG